MAIHDIPAGTPFLDALARGLRERTGGDPLALARATVLLPTRRAARALAAAMLRQSGAAASVAPRVLALGDVDDDDETWEAAAAAPEEPIDHALSPLERLVRLADLVRASGDVPPAAALRSATALARLLDSAALEEVPLDGLETLVPDQLAIHWQRSLAALDAVRTRWPTLLRELGRADPTARRSRQLRRRAERWRERPPAGLVVAAGSTGSVPATRALLAVIAGLPDGHVVLPGLDHMLDEEAWTAAGVDATHPQHGLALLVEALGARRADIRPWTAGATVSPRAAMLAEALRPAATTDAWRRAARVDDAAFAGLQRIDAADSDEEAGVIALVLRGVLETPGRTAALVTPDRRLARRVAAELGRWGIAVDDSAGAPLTRTTAGAFLVLAAEAIAGDSPVGLLALLKHPFARAGRARPELRRLARRIERKLLRRPAPPRGLKALARRADGESGALLTALSEAAAPFAALLADERAAPLALLEAHVAFAEWLASGPEAPDARELWSGDAGESASRFARDLAAALAAMAPIRGAAWPALFGALADEVAVRPRTARHPRLAIWGPLEARLQSADLVVLGGLNEGTWPPAPPEDPWLSQAMRRALGLPAAERRIGLSGHDFTMAACAPAALLTRAVKVDGAPTRPARWLQRLDALLAGDERWSRIRATPWCAWRAALDRPEGDVARPAPPPEPRPPLAARPRRLSATQVETWIRDPYAIYARFVLGLRPLDPLDPEPSGADRGNLVHTALSTFHRERRDESAAEALARLLAHGRDAFGPLLDRPAVRAIWWPRFARLARWLVEWERRRLAEGVAPLAAEVDGGLPLSGPAGMFELHARADRVDRLGPRAIAIVDWKTGALPGLKEMAVGLAPQLALEGAIAAAGGFSGIASARSLELLHVRLTGGEPPGKARAYAAPPSMKACDVATLIDRTRAGLERLIAAYDDPATPYLSRPRPKFVRHVGDYDLLARVAEWSAALGEEA